VKVAVVDPVSSDPILAVYSVYESDDTILILAVMEAILFAREAVKVQL
jgi:hypothetical protein